MKNARALQKCVWGLKFNPHTQKNQKEILFLVFTGDYLYFGFVKYSISQRSVTNHFN